MTIYEKYAIKKDHYNRFDQRNIVFGKVNNDPTAPFYMKDFYDNVETIVQKNKPGYSRIDFARVRGAWSVYDHFSEAFGNSWNQKVNAIAGLDKPVSFLGLSKERMTQELKLTAHIFGALKTGITKVDPNLIYSHDIQGRKMDISDELTYAVVVLVSMDPSNIQKSPAFPASVSTGLGYSKLAFIVACMAGFIRNLGYQALSMGNDTALSIPLAIEAGLGELGRNGLLITPELGPCVRIGKIFTDMPLEIDYPIDFGVTEFCNTCKLCAQNCESGAISSDDHPSYKTVCPSNNQGIKRWAVDHYKCYSFWVENGAECSTCIAVCPYLKKTMRQLR
ncbi:MAG TPA: reductive dehalogenase [Thermotogota bacterium]|nr:reductive dehalogenase [Thermotogota bacterium]